MRHTVIKYAGRPLRRTQARVPGWAGDGKQGNHFQLFMHRPFMDLATSAMEVVYHGPATAMIDYGVGQNPPKPLEQVGAMFWAWDAETTVRTPPGHSLLVLPHPAALAAEETPLAVPGLVDTDWWAGQLRILFRYRNRSMFIPGEPVAQVLAFPRSVQRIEPMTQAERDAAEDDADRLASMRASVATAERFGQDNAYAVLKEMVDAGRPPDWLQVPVEPRAFRLIGRFNRDVRQAVPNPLPGHPGLLRDTPCGQGERDLGRRAAQGADVPEGAAPSDP